MIFNSINIIGAGNVAFHLAHAIYNLDQNILLTVYARSPKNDQLFLEVMPQLILVHDLSLLPPADLTIISVNDDSIKNISEKLKNQTGILAHTSGSVPITILAKYPGPKAVFYPLQTFSLQREIDWTNIPFLINGDDKETINKLLAFALQISGKSIEATDAQRKSTHIAAVFANNFSNHMMALAEEWLQSNELSFEILKPLIHETIRKLDTITPMAAQTGPAIRHDQEVINEHLTALEKYPAQYKVYELITNSIREMYPMQEDLTWEING